MSHSPSSDPHKGPDAHTIDHVRRDLKKYITVGVLLLVFTLITVALSYVNFEKIFGSRQANMIVAMIVATFKAGLVAAIFMHLMAERWTIYRFLLITAF